MDFSLLTYNLLYNKAHQHVDKIVDKYKPDIFCLQEIQNSKKRLKILEENGYKLAEFSSSFKKFGKIYGVATYYNKDKFKLLNSEIILLPRGVYESFLLLLRTMRGGNNRRTVLKTTFSRKSTSKKVVVYNTHLTVIGANGVRLKQIQKTLKDINIDPKNATIIAGDFNYFPYSRKKLEKLMTRRGLKEATNKIPYTFNREKIKNELLNKIGIKFFPSATNLKLDYIFFKGLKNLKTEKINVRYSDHYPIKSQFNINHS